ncbi:MAG: gamma-glutamyl-gamma-aminobutyrate hydrolase family protein [Anaerolineae bacterium]
MSLPLIGIPTHNERSKEDKVPPRYAMSQSYTWALEEVGGAPILLPLLQNKAILRQLYDQLDGLLLAGGGDLDPARYGEAPNPYLWDVDVLRDRVETIMTLWALEDGKPILAICRGVQMLNVASGGTLYQDVPSMRPSPITHNWHLKRPRHYRAHHVDVKPGTRLHDILGARVQVNSLHHQAVKDVAPGFVPNAIAPDGLVEGIEKAGTTFVVGVQWHPEVLAIEDAGMRQLFAAFVDEARAWKARRAKMEQAA